jgi:hypothetical protein
MLFLFTTLCFALSLPPVQPAIGEHPVANAIVTGPANAIVSEPPNPLVRHALSAETIIRINAERGHPYYVAALKASKAAKPNRLQALIAKMVAKVNPRASRPVNVVAPESVNAAKPIAITADDTVAFITLKGRSGTHQAAPAN